MGTKKQDREPVYFSREAGFAIMQALRRMAPTQGYKVVEWSERKDRQLEPCYIVIDLEQVRSEILLTRVKKTAKSAKYRVSISTSGQSADDFRMRHFAATDLSDGVEVQVTAHYILEQLKLVLPITRTAS